MGPSGSARQPTVEIRLRGHLDLSWSSSFPGFEMAHSVGSDGTPLTVLTGPVVDEAGLHGMLARIRDLGIPLLLVRRDEGSSDSGGGPPDHAGKESES